MIDTDHMGELQATVQKLRDLAQHKPDSSPPLEEIIEDYRSVRGGFVALGVLLDRLGDQLVGFAGTDGELTSRVKNPADAAAQLAAVHSVTANVLGAMSSIVGGLQVAETALARIQPAPTPEETADV